MIFVWGVAFFASANGQLTHLDTIVSRSIRDSTATIDHGHARVIADSVIGRLFISNIEGPDGGRTEVILDHLEGMVSSTDTAARMSLTASVLIISAHSRIPDRRIWTWNYPIALSAEDREVLETNRSRYVHLVSTPSESFWSGTLLPALVLVGAAAIVALFFLVRS